MSSQGLMGLQGWDTQQQYDALQQQLAYTTGTTSGSFGIGGLLTDFGVLGPALYGLGGSFIPTLPQGQPTPSPAPPIPEEIQWLRGRVEAILWKPS